jgi:hypothetical protein
VSWSRVGANDDTGRQANRYHPISKTEDDFRNVGELEIIRYESFM